MIQSPSPPPPSSSSSRRFTSFLSSMLRKSTSSLLYTDEIWMIVLLIMEFIFSYFIVQYIKYTEIDYHAYMEQCTLIVQHHIRDYYFIRGNTGPLVYPAGFVYIYSLLQYITGYKVVEVVIGENENDENDSTITINSNNEYAIRMTQYIFIIIYLFTQMMVFLIYHTSTTRIIQTTRIMKRKSSTSSSSSSSSSTSSSETESSSSSFTKQIWKFRIVFLLLCGSKRIHSIYLLRLFNDGITMFFLYISIYCFIYASTSTSTLSSNTSSNRHHSLIQQQQQRHHWIMNIGCIFFSIAVSIKMNVLLLAPGLLLLLLHVSNNIYHCIYRIIVYCGIPQLLLGLPFLLHHPIHYIHKAFELDRIFFYIWTVNWKFLPEDIFVSKPLSILLLVCHIGTLIYFAHQWIQSISGYTNNTASMMEGQSQHQPRRPIFFINHHPSNRIHSVEHSTTTTTNNNHPRRIRVLSPIYITSTMFTCNFIGIVFARTLHYQFYSWYFHAIPFLLFCNDVYNYHEGEHQRKLFSYPLFLRIAIIMCIEWAFLTFPATPFSSMLLQISHVLILIQIRPPPYHFFLCPNDDDDDDKEINDHHPSIDSSKKVQ